MKRAKKLFAVVLSAALALMLAVPAFAVDDNTADTSTTSYKYEIYQIFTGDYYNGILSNVKWGQNAEIPKAADATQAKVGEAVPDSVLKELTAVTPSHSDSEKLAVITKYANLTNPYYSTSSTQDDDDESSITAEITGKTAKFDGLPNGYYLVKDADGSLNENDTYTTYVVQVVDETLTIERKDDLPDVEKKIVETETDDAGNTTKRLDTNEASIGDTVNYEITGTLPSNLEEYKEYYYVFTDTLSKGLTYKEDSVEVEVVNGETTTDVTSYFYKKATTNATTGETTITVGIQDLLALTLDDSDNTVLPVTINKDSEIVVTYSATLNQNAVIAGDGNTNDVVLAYSNDPNNSGEGSTTPPPENPKDEPKKPDAYGETPKDTVVTYTTELTITKRAESEKGDILPGAEFTLTGDGVMNIVLVTEETFEKDENGTYYKLNDGTYTTTAPTDLYDSLTTKYSYDEASGEYKVDENGEYWKLTDDTYTTIAPTELYDDTEQKYAKSTEVVAKGTGQGENGAKTDVVGTIDEGGHVTFTGLGAGKYTITESKTPAGYNTIAPVTFTLTFDTKNLTFVSDNKDVAVGEDNKLSTTIVNKSGSTLPSTGGMGTQLFYIVGGVLVVGAGILLVTKKRMNGDK